MKTKLFNITLLLGMVFSLASCNDDTTSPAEEKTTVVYWYRTNTEAQTVLESFKSAFEALHTDITIDLQPQTGSYNELAEKVVSGFAVNNYPNIVQAYPDNVANFLYQDSSKVVNLNTFINDSTIGLSQEDKEDIIGLDEGSNYVLEGTYSLPFYSSTEVMYYNASVLHGLTLTGVNNGRAIDATYINNLTWTELFENLGPAIIAHDEAVDEEDKILKTKDSNGNETYHAILDYQSEDNQYITLSTQKEIPYSKIENGVGTATMFASSQAKEMVRDLSTYAQSHYITSQEASGNAYSSSLLFDQRALFIIDSTAGASWLSTSNMEIGVASIPQEEGKDKKVISQGASLTILNRNEKENKAAWEWYKFISNKDNALKWATSTSYNPFRKSVYDNESYKELRQETTVDYGSSNYVINRVAKVVEEYSDNNMYFIAPPYASSTGTSSSLRTAVGGLIAKAYLYTSGTPSDEVIDQWFLETQNNSLS